MLLKRWKLKKRAGIQVYINLWLGEIEDCNLEIFSEVRMILKAFLATIQALNIIVAVAENRFDLSQ